MSSVFQVSDIIKPHMKLEDRKRHALKPPHVMKRVNVELQSNVLKTCAVLFNSTVQLDQTSGSLFVTKIKSAIKSCM
jgi:hypothetical protein